MQLTPIKHLFDHDAPFSTVYLESRSPAEDAEHQLRLRWDDLRGRLEEDGAPVDSLEALDSAILAGGENLTQVHAEGRVLVADADPSCSTNPGTPPSAGATRRTSAHPPPWATTSANAPGRPCCWSRSRTRKGPCCVE